LLEEHSGIPISSPLSKQYRKLSKIVARWAHLFILSTFSKSLLKVFSIISFIPLTCGLCRVCMILTCMRAWFWCACMCCVMRVCVWMCVCACTCAWCMRVCVCVCGKYVLGVCDACTNASGRDTGDTFFLILP
jgi:hypothetical protein